MFAADCRDPSTAQMLDLYYKFFHPAHPFILPRYWLNHQSKTDPSSIQHLLLVLEYIGSLYTSPSKPSKTSQLLDRAFAALNNPDIPINGFTVQAKLLLAIVIHCSNDFDQARDVIDRAIGVALDIGMQSRNYAIINGDGNRVMEENWRRTWWGLYIIDGVFARIRRAPTFWLYRVDSDVDLPCEEREYETGVSILETDFQTQYFC